MARVTITFFFVGAAVLAQPADTGTAHKAAATALLNSNNTGAAHLACPAVILPVPTANPPGGGRGPRWYASAGKLVRRGWAGV
jgi:hypothetical protein